MENCFTNLLRPFWVHNDVVWSYKCMGNLPTHDYWYFLRLHGLLHCGALDDILIFSQYPVEHIKHVWLVVAKLYQRIPFAKLEKCKLSCSQYWKVDALSWVQVWTLAMLRSLMAKKVNIFLNLTRPSCAQLTHSWSLGCLLF